MPDIGGSWPWPDGRSRLRPIRAVAAHIHDGYEQFDEPTINIIAREHPSVDYTARFYLTFPEYVRGYESVIGSLDAMKRYVRVHPGVAVVSELYLGPLQCIADHMNVPVIIEGRVRIVRPDRFRPAYQWVVEDGRVRVAEESFPAERPLNPAERTLLGI